MPLHAEVAAFLDQLATDDGPPVTELSPEQLRANFKGMAVVGSRPEHPAATEDRTVAGPDGDVPVRIYRPEVSGPLPIVVFFHGGGWTIGDLDTADGLCQHLAVDTPAVVVSVDYRLAPEHPFPAGLLDAEAAVRWAAGHARELGADPGRLAVAGDSSGGNFAAVVARRLRDGGGPAIAFQLLVYPVTDLTCSQPSHTENAEGYLLTEEIMGWFIANYLAGADPEDPHVSPLLADDFAGLPPALVVTAEFDPLRDEGEGYAARLREAGVEAKAVRYEGMVHYFLSMDLLLSDAKGALADTVATLRNRLAPGPS
jgi:acetyl esterase